MPEDPSTLTPADKIAAEGQRIYVERYKADFERQFNGQYVAIDIDTGTAYRAEFPELALTTARKQAPSGIFHLIRIGSPAAFKASHRTHARHHTRTLRRTG